MTSVVRVYIVIFIGMSVQNGQAQSTTSARASDRHHYIHLAHTRTGANPNMDGEAEGIDFAVFDMLWLGGDLAMSTSGDDLTMMHVDSIFNLGGTSTLWALGNHDYADLQRIHAFTGRPAYYAYHRNKITFLVLDTQDSLSHISGLQKDLVRSVTDTVSESSHLVVLHHKLIWMYGHPYLQSRIPYVSNAGIGDSTCFYCIHENNFYEDIYPELLRVEERGVEVICIGGDIGFRSNEFEYLTSEGIQFLASGIEAGSGENQALIFNHDVAGGKLAWEFVHLSELQVPLDLRPPELHLLNISPDTVNPGDSIRIILQVEDGESGVDEIGLDFEGPLGEQIISVKNRIEDWTAMGDQYFFYDIMVADSAKAGIWNLSLLNISDSAGNILSLSNKDTLLASFAVSAPLGPDIRKFSELSLYPVPSSGILYFSDDPGIVAIQVFDQLGRAAELPVRTYIDLTDRPDGIYFVRLQFKDNQYVIRKVLITKMFRR